jgi:hypothetical protein
MTIDERLREGLRLDAQGPDGAEIERDLLVVRARGGRVRRRRAGARMAVAAVVLVVMGLVATSLIGQEEETNVTTSRDSTWKQILRPLPRIEGVGGFAIQDFVQGAVNVGARKPSEGATDEERAAYWDQVSSGLPAGTFLPLKTLSAEQLRTELGFEHSQVARMVTIDASGTGRPGLHRLAILEGDFDPEVIEAAVKADPVWSAQLETTAHSGVDYYAWGDDSMVIEKRTPVRTLGIGGRLIVFDRTTVAWTTSTFLAEAAIDAWTGAQDRFADDTRTQELIDAVESRHADWASITAAQPGKSALGFGVHSGSPTELILALHEVSPNAAEQAASSLRTAVEDGRTDEVAYRDQFAITQFEVNGTLVAARLTYTGDRPLLDAISARRVPMFAFDSAPTARDPGP